MRLWLNIFIGGTWIAAATACVYHRKQTGSIFVGVGGTTVIVWRLERGWDNGEWERQHVCGGGMWRDFQWKGKFPVMCVKSIPWQCCHRNAC